MLILCYYSVKKGRKQAENRQETGSTIILVYTIILSKVGEDCLILLYSVLIEQYEIEYYRIEEGRRQGKI